MKKQTLEPQNRGEKTIRNNIEETVEDEEPEDEDAKDDLEKETLKPDLEKETKKPSDLKTKRLPDLDKDDTVVKAVVSLPKKTYKKLGELAFEREVSRASIMREALKGYFQKLRSSTAGKLTCYMNTDKLRNGSDQYWTPRCARTTSAL